SDERRLGTRAGFVKIGLPIHQPPRHQKFFYRINSFFLDDQTVFGHIQHGDEPLTVDIPFGNPGIKTSAFEVIQSIDSELTSNELFKKPPMIISLENPDGQG